MDNVNGFRIDRGSEIQFLNRFGMGLDSVFIKGFGYLKFSMVSYPVPSLIRAY